MSDADRAPRAYTPHLDGPNLRMGLSPIGPTEWLQVDSAWSRYHAHKGALGDADRVRVFQQTAIAEPAVAELVPVVRAHLLEDHADVFGTAPSGAVCHTPSGVPLAEPAGDTALWTVSTWVQEDLLILQAIDGQYCLTAGSLCLPSRWSLSEKLGEPLHAIHAPVPELNARLGDRIDRFFNHLRVDRPVERFNWSLQTDDALAEFPAPDEPVTDLHYRVERQTLRRLPETGAVVFTVRIYVVPFEVVAAVPGAVAQLRDDIAAMPEAFSDYKRMPHFRDVLSTYQDPTDTET
ncbi:MAG: DUF3445 domain-containing protein [Pseudomonadota bacterium]